MGKSEIVALVITHAVLAALLVVTVLMFFGKGGRLMPTYRYEPKGEKALKYHLKLMRKAAAFVLAAIAVAYAGVMCLIFVDDHSQTLGGVLCGMGVLVAISGVLYMSVNERILQLKRKARDDYWDPREENESRRDF